MVNTQTIYEKELQSIKTWDEIQGSEAVHCKANSYQFITTAGHGYLVVPMDDKYIRTAKDIVAYGFVGEHAVYLEEDCEMPEFLKDVNR